ncbi:hypothetical protein SAMN05444410_106120 [Hydrobacter penzbergensis]|uniref:Uncharacterized protein n=1 Tax=Hydrobacter penzbergensis TaxID=1235997 RepID=A0A8X8IC64_9BACT|nr:hypothetical protein [Hydrobacter penzbergensis]SDW84743.1 hypothetical protein SAMN05444410_106120 [Hydrobacter penzbergensis]
MKTKKVNIESSVEEKIEKEAVYKAIQKLHEEAQKEKEKEEKAILLRKLREITKNKNIVVSNYAKI